MVHDSFLAEDLMQETFVQLHRKLAMFRGDAAFTTWLHRMTVNIVLMHLHKRGLPVVSLDHLMNEQSDEHFRRGFGANDCRQVGVVDRLALEHALATLAPGYRSVFLLHDVHGLEHREIASIQGCGLGNSKSQLHKARRALRYALSAQAARALPGPAQRMSLEKTKSSASRAVAPPGTQSPGDHSFQASCRGTARTPAVTDGSR